jgi:acylphosphatase
MPHSATAARRYVLRGRVQGVGYRDFAQRAATALGLTGYARNLDDGRVEVFVVGPIEKIAELAGALHKGPRYGEVHGVDEQEAEPRQHSHFQIEV